MATTDRLLKKVKDPTMRKRILRRMAEIEADPFCGVMLDGRRKERHLREKEGDWRITFRRVGAAVEFIDVSPRDESYNPRRRK